MDRVLNILLALMILNIFTNAELATGYLVNGSAYQSSTYKPCTAEKAFDGETAFNSSSCTCSVTDSGLSPRWWEMNFGSKYLIGSIVVTGRTGEASNQSRGLAVYISNGTMGQNVGTVVHSPDWDIGLTVQFDLAPRIAQFINIKKDVAKDVMTICEVKVFGAKCPTGMFGDKCLRRCHCKNQCEVITGNCSNCKPGWKPPTCETVCSKGFFGHNCSEECSNNCRNEICNAEDGNCVDGCNPGFDNTIHRNCSSECKPGFYDDCTSVCGHCKHPPCNKTDGHCTSGCAEGYTGEKCEKECPAGSYGDKCSSNCSQHCIDKECHHVNGMCDLGCNPGYDFLKDPKCESPLVEDHSKQESFPTGAVVGGVIGAVCGVAAIVGVLFFFYRRIPRKRQTIESSKTYENAEFNTPTQTVSHSLSHISTNISESTKDTDVNYYEFENSTPGIQVHNLWDYIRDNKRNECQHFNDEFAKLPTGLVHKHDVAGREENKGKNRYREMHAYDHSRVKLQKEKSDDCDYINASYIDGYDKARKFIASQGPTKNMIDDFWRMVWQENVEKIVMLTNIIEMATVKCLRYWPEMDQICSFGGIDISFTAVKTFRDYEIRTLIAKKEQSESRRIQQYHFKAWPDKDVPDNGWCLVQFLNAVETKSTNSPIIVHCSAGVGRTGTFVALDNLVDQAKIEKYVRPLQMVEALRRQRVNMVQTKDQYIYLHEALAEALLMGTDHVWHRQFESVHSFMMTRESGQKQTRLVQQFLLIEKSLTNESQQVQNGPEYGNMETILSEIDAYRPKLKKRGSDFTQHLGAILLPSFSGKNTFLPCKSPCEEQLEEFWSLVEEQHVITVIMLTSTSCRAHQTSVYMGGNGNGKVGRYSVNFIQERKNKTFNERTFSFRDENNEDEDYLTTIKQFQISGWADEETLPPMQNMLDCLDAVRKWQPHLAENRPVLIHCETGHKRSGLIAALLNELNRMEKTRGQINIVETVKTMKQRNKDILPSTVQYKFMYDSLLEHAMNTTDYENI